MKITGGINLPGAWIFIIEMATAIQELDKTSSTNSELIATNVTWLQQALSLLDQLDDETFGSAPKLLAPHRVGSHLRHVLEFYECFLEGIAFSRIDYDARKRD